MIYTPLFVFPGSDRHTLLHLVCKTAKWSLILAGKQNGMNRAMNILKPMRTVMDRIHPAFWGRPGTGLRHLLSPFPFLLALLLGMSATSVQGVAFYWDVNGTTAGSGNAGGIWDADPFWSDVGFLEPDKEAAARMGVQATQAWEDKRDVYFSAGGDGTGTFTITIQKKVIVWNTAVEEGNLTIRGGILQMQHEGDRPGYVSVRPGASLVIDSIILKTDVREEQPDVVAFYKVGPGLLVLNQPVFLIHTNLATPDAIIEGGILRLGTSNVLPQNSRLVLRNGGRGQWVGTPATFHTGGFSHSLGPLQVTGANASIDFGEGTSALVFADSDGEEWGPHLLSIRNYTTGSDSLRIGNDGDGFDQKLQQIRFVDYPVAGNTVRAVIDSLGFIMPDPNAPVITQHPQDLTVTAGHPATFSVTVSGTGPYQYEWLHNGVPIQGATGPTLQIPDAEYHHAGEYRVAVYNGSSITESRTARLQVTVPEAPAPRLTLIRLEEPQVTLAWESVKARRYLVEHHTDLASEQDWQPLMIVRANGPLTTFQYELMEGESQSSRYYRVVLVPELPE
jgi:hypothetical protein